MHGICMVSPSLSIVAAIFIISSLIMISYSLRKQWRFYSKFSTDTEGSMDIKLASKASESCMSSVDLCETQNWNFVWVHFNPTPRKKTDQNLPRSENESVHEHSSLCHWRKSSFYNASANTQLCEGLWDMLACPRQKLCLGLISVWQWASIEEPSLGGIN